MAEFKDYYQILGVPRDAGEKDIRKAFRRLARQHHPDVNPGDKAAEVRFKELTEANEVLGDPEKRKLYDRYGKDWQAARAAGATGAAGETGWAGTRAGDSGGVHYRTVSSEDLEDLFGDENPFSDFFHSMFGRAAGRDARARGASSRGPAAATAEGPVQVSLREAFTGARRTFQTPEGKRVEVTIPAGVADGTTLRVPGLRLRVQVQPDPIFERRGKDLQTVVQVPLATALLGGEVDVPTPKGGKVKLRVPPETQNGTRLRLKGLGMPDPRAGSAGDLYADVRVRLPLPLDDRTRKLAQELGSA